VCPNSEVFLLPVANITRTLNSDLKFWPYHLHKIACWPTLSISVWRCFDRAAVW